MKEIGPRFLKRPGGYTRIVRLPNRLKDNAEMVLLEFVEKGEKAVVKKVKKSEIKKETKKIVKSDITKKTGMKAAPKVKAAAPKLTVTRQKKG